MPIFYISNDGPTDPSHKCEGDFEITLGSYDDGKYVPRKETWKQFSYAHGKVVMTYERNGYDDSDFIAVCFDTETQSEYRIEYASTRYSSTGFHATVDASDETMAAWDCYRQAQAAEAKRLRDLELQQVIEERMAKMVDAGLDSFTINQFLSRSTGWSESIQEGCYALLKTKKFRSKFRESLRNQLVAWLQDPAPSHPTPFSTRQLEFLVR